MCPVPRQVDRSDARYQGHQRNRLLRQVSRLLDIICSPGLSAMTGDGVLVDRFLRRASNLQTDPGRNQETYRRLTGVWCTREMPRLL